MHLKILSVRNQNDIIEEMNRIGVDIRGINIMCGKAISCLIKMEKVPSWIANLLKQEMLSLGGDIALHKGAITGKKRNTDCLVMGNLNQLGIFIEKLQKQPPSLKRIAQLIKEQLDNYQRDKFSLQLGRFRLNLYKHTAIMAIVNLTTDSFSGDGLLNTGYKLNSKHCLDFLERRVDELIKDGADIIDVGGESTRPGARPVPLNEEINRTIPLIKRLAKKINLPISIDTYKPQIAKRALDAGASIVNNIMGIKNNISMLKVLKKYNAGYVIMHIKGVPRTMQQKPQYENLMDEIISDLNNAMLTCFDAGIKPERLIVDPGIGFGKTLVHNLEILRRLSELKSLGRPILLGPSRKSFLGKILNCPVEDRLMGSAAAVALAIINGANIVRVHDVKQIRQVSKVIDEAIYN